MIEEKNMKSETTLENTIQLVKLAQERKCNFVREIS